MKIDPVAEALAPWKVEDYLNNISYEVDPTYVPSDCPALRLRLRLRSITCPLFANSFLLVPNSSISTTLDNVNDDNNSIQNGTTLRPHRIQGH